jgi:hypothetical protein
MTANVCYWHKADIQLSPDGQQAAVQDAELFAKHPADNKQRFAPAKSCALPWEFTPCNVRNDITPEIGGTSLFYRSSVRIRYREYK